MSENMNNLSIESNTLKDSIIKIRQEAMETREAFVSDIAQVLSESRNVKSLRLKMKDLQRKLHHAESYEFDLKETRKRLKELEKSTWERLPLPPHGVGVVAVAGGGGGGATSVVTPRKILKKFLFHLEDKILLEIFAFLETQDVLRAAQVQKEGFTTASSSPRLPLIVSLSSSPSHRLPLIVSLSSSPSHRLSSPLLFLRSVGLSSKGSILYLESNLKLRKQSGRLNQSLSKN
jgi:hypothetical protein